MKISTRKGLVVRLVTGGAAGLLLVVGMFALLLHLVDAPVDVEPAVKMPRPEFTQVIRLPPRDLTPPPDKIDRPPVPDMPSVTVFDDDISATDTRPGRPTGPEIFRTGPGVVFTGPPGSGLSIGNDQDTTERVRIRPDYPMRAQMQGIEGWVHVQYTITATGAVRDAVVVAADPEGVFDGAALAAIARWRYNPRVVNGEPVERVGVQTRIEFQLTE
jgi:periplasmic protein TonB